MDSPLNLNLIFDLPILLAIKSSLVLLRAKNVFTVLQEANKQPVSNPKLKPNSITF